MLLLAGVLVTGSAGCRGFLDDQKEMWSDFYNRPDPLTEVKTTTSADRKARFIAKLHEPAQYGGTQAQQDEMVKLLTEIAMHDPAPACRLQAIHKLGTFRDPRRLQALQGAYDHATVFVPEVNSQVRQQALKALGETGDAMARAELIRVARAAAKEDNYFDQQLTLDERLTAVRALANFRDPEVVDTLVHIARTEKDIALRDRAQRSLETVTGRRLPEDPQDLEQVLNTMGTANPAQQKIGGPVQLMKGWQPAN
jgi:hypothetical protein